MSVELKYNATELFSFVKQWAYNRGLINKDYAQKQALKVMEELGETCSAMLKGKEDELIDGIGDTFVTLIILAEQLGLDPTECLHRAYNEIKDRKGVMVNGTFIKE